MSKILFVEDGSVDVDELKQILPTTPVIIYRQGSLKPEFKDVDVEVTYDRVDETNAEKIRTAIHEAFRKNCKTIVDLVVGGVRERDEYELDEFNIDYFADEVINALHGADSK